jgi:hypothetical protein
LRSKSALNLNLIWNNLRGALSHRRYRTAQLLANHKN